MRTPFRWDPCISHHGDEVTKFINEFFPNDNRKVFFIAGAGFDPRAHVIAKYFHESGSDIKAIFIRENRPNPDKKLIRLSEDNAKTLTTMVPNSTIIGIDIFGHDNAVIGGRNIVNAIYQQSFVDVTDIVVDISALSIGISFPAIRYLSEAISELNNPNLHVIVSHNPGIDEAITPISSDSPGFVHGFRGHWGLDETASAAKLWLPQLALGRRATLRHLFEFLTPHETCPILPFPASNPRLGDDLAEYFLEELDQSWAVDSRNIVYAAESDPLDLYRTILSMDDRRKPVYDEVGGSLMVLSPVGSKLMALGALLAALERNLPVAYLESVGYECGQETNGNNESSSLFHVWLEGGAYPPRDKLQ